MLFVAGLRRSRFGDANRLAIDCLDNSIPSGKGFLQGDIDRCDQVVAAALEDGVFFLCDLLV